MTRHILYKYFNKKRVVTLARLLPPIANMTSTLLKTHCVQAVREGFEPPSSDSIKNSKARLVVNPYFLSISISAPSRQEGVYAIA
jgi:hypothetical protein